MRRWIIWLAATLMVGLAFVSPVSAVNVNNFTITNYDMKMSLSRDDEGRSRLKTVETITAQFPNYDQNRGIERAIPANYDGHNVSLEVESVTKPDGSAWEYTTYRDRNDNLVVRIGNADRYVHGQQTYVITYTQRDVTKSYTDTGKDEFYWDTNGTEWQVPIGRLSVELSVDDSIKAALTGDAFCYQGKTGSTGRCQINHDDGVFAATVMNLAPRENVTLAIGFTADTFTGYQPTLMERLFAIWPIVQAVIVPLGFFLTIWIIAKFVRATSRSREMGTIVPEYLPPKDVSVTAAAKIAKGAYGSVMAAQLIDLAVRHYIKLVEGKNQTLFGSKPRYSVEIIKSIDDLKDEEKELLSDMFGHLPSVGESLNLNTLKNNTAYYSRTTDNEKKLRDLIVEKYGLKVVDEGLKKWLRRTAAGILLLSILTLSPFLPTVAIVAFVLSFSARTLTDKGLALKRYLSGLKDYIKVGEQERIKMLQSPEGAEKVSEIAEDANDPSQRVVLYEKVLPYAVLFNQEKEWSKQLGQYYEKTGQQPDWYTGRTAFNAAAFSSAMNTFATSTSTYGGASSSSSGGSSGGGFSGGGGGGGGGGGW